MKSIHNRCCKAINKLLMIMAFCLVSSNFSYGQSVYMWFSERDCVNCNTAIHVFIEKSKDDKLFKMVFPSNFKGKKFEKFNKIYFKDAINSDAVVFSDELSEIANSVFDNKSGVFSIDETTKEVIYALNSDDFSVVDDKKALLKSFSSTALILDFDQEGVSDSAVIRCNYDENKFFLIDPFFKSLYVADGQKFRDYDFNQINLVDLIKRAFTDKQYQSYLANKEQLEELGVNGLVLNEISYAGGLYYIHLGVPDIYKTEEGTKINFDIYRPSKYVILSEEALFKGELINNIYAFNSNNQDGFAYSIFDYPYKDKLYKINNARDNTLPNYLLSQFRVDPIKREIVFEKYMEKILNPFFVKRDTQEVVYPFYSYYNEIVFGGNTEFKTIVDVAAAKVKEIDVEDGNIVQIWKNAKNHYVVLAAMAGEFRLIEYALDWKTIKSERLYVNKKAVSDIRFTKNAIYMVSSKGVYSVGRTTF